MSCDDSLKNKHDLLNVVKFYDIKKVKTVFFRRFLGYVIYQWSNYNAPHTHCTVIFLKSICLRQLVICDTVPLT